MTAPDPIEELVAVLAAAPSVTAIVSDRVFGGALTKAGREGMPQAAIVLKPAGGPGRRGRLKTRRTRIDTVCYGRTLLESWDLHRAVRDLLEDLKTTGSIKSIETSSDGVNATDPTTQWPTCYASYLALSTTHI